MAGGSDHRRMSIDNKPPGQLLANSGLSQLRNVGENFHNMVSQSQRAESIANNSKKLQDDLHELGRQIKHYEENVKYLKSLKNKLEDSIPDLQVSLGEYNKASLSTTKSEEEEEEETVERIIKHENSAAALLCIAKSQVEADHPFGNDVIGVVATLGKVDDDNLSRLLSEYLGQETMLAVVCKTYEGVKALEAYTKDSAIHERFLVICLENIRPYAGEFIADDPQRRLDLPKPRLLDGEIPHGFLGFAVNMISIDSTNLRETLFYNLFSNLQVYLSRKDMLKAMPCIQNGAISLDGGIIRRPGVLSLGHHRGDIDIKFPNGSERFSLPEEYFDIQNRIKETKWKIDRVYEDMQREQALLDRTRFNYETKKQEFVRVVAQYSSQMSLGRMGRLSTPRSFNKTS